MPTSDPVLGLSAAPMGDEHLVSSLRPVQAHVDLGRLAENFRLIHAHAGLPVMPVVKADAYGHGAAAVGLRLEKAGAAMLAVAYPEEGALLRQAGVTIPIVVLAGFWPGQLELLRAHRLNPIVSTPDQVGMLLGAVRQGPLPPVHVKVDTGMTRLGFTREAMIEAAVTLAAAGLTVEGVMTHLASADEDAACTELQLDRFDEAVHALADAGIRPGWIHACNSAGLAFIRKTHTLVRPGLIVYGLRPRPLSPDLPVQPVMRISAAVTLVKDIPKGTPVSYGGRFVAQRETRLATIPIGYADGVPRTDAMRERGHVELRGQRLPIAGTVCMDLLMVDVTDHPDVTVGDEVTVFGDTPDAWDVSEWSGTIAWEVLTHVGSRVPRVYEEGGEVVSVDWRFERAR